MASGRQRQAPLSSPGGTMAALAAIHAARGGRPGHVEAVGVAWVTWVPWVGAGQTWSWRGLLELLAAWGHAPLEEPE